MHSFEREDPRAGGVEGAVCREVPEMNPGAAVPGERVQRVDRHAVFPVKIRRDVPVPEVSLVAHVLNSRGGLSMINTLRQHHLVCPPIVCDGPDARILDMLSVVLFPVEDDDCKGYVFCATSI